MSFLTLECATKCYQLGSTQIVAVKDISLTIEGGEFTVICGPSGSGKSTLLNMLSTIDLPSEGDYRIDNTSVLNMGDRQLTQMRQKRVGIIFQSFNLVPVMTTRENVMLPGQLHGGRVVPELKSRAETLLEEVGVGQYAEHRPDQLSGGQRQRVALARALINRPELVIADEPTANLDSDNSQKIIALLAEMNRKYGITFVFSTHDQLLLRSARRCVQLVDGRVVEDTQCSNKVDATVNTIMEAQ
ncbi:MAG: ABC transporter ATP-binding protein [Gammaproteobacteria bacterium]|nr:ABC transporter ATP-binding protein [Gammaproteobacteria bacterium]